jgi:hypothetical protein
MGYYMRVFSPSTKVPALGELQGFLRKSKLPVELDLEEGTPGKWDNLLLRHQGMSSDAGGICIIESNPVKKDELGEEEIEEFLESLEDTEPKVNAKWLTGYLKKVRTIYCFQVLHGGADSRSGWDYLRALRWELWQDLGGVGQADSEGFSNPNGYQITWEFDDSVTGRGWAMALLSTDGSWTKFRMDLGNRNQREAFRAGQVPAGAEVLE